MATFFLGERRLHMEVKEREEETKILLSNKWNRYKQETGWISRAFLRLSNKKPISKGHVL